MHILNVFNKKHLLNDSRAFICDSELEKNQIDYMRYFFKERNRSVLSEPVKKQLISLSNEELVSLALDVLSVTFGFLRNTAEEFNPKSSDKNERFYRAMIWHLSDAVHNIPSHLDVVRAHIDLINYITEFFVFVECLDRLKNRPTFVNYREDILFSFHLDIRSSLETNH